MNDWNQFHFIFRSISFLTFHFFQFHQFYFNLPVAALIPWSKGMNFSQGAKGLEYNFGTSLHLTFFFWLNTKQHIYKQYFSIVLHSAQTKITNNFYNKTKECSNPFCSLLEISCMMHVNSCAVVYENMYSSSKYQHRISIR